MIQATNNTVAAASSDEAEDNDESPRYRFADYDNDEEEDPGYLNEDNHFFMASNLLEDAADWFTTGPAPSLLQPDDGELKLDIHDASSVNMYFPGRATNFLMASLCHMLYISMHSYVSDDPEDYTGARGGRGFMLTEGHYG